MIGPWTGDDASRIATKDAHKADIPEVSDRRRVRRNRHLTSERSNWVQDDRPSRTSGAQDRYGTSAPYVASAQEPALALRKGGFCPSFHRSILRSEVGEQALQRVACSTTNFPPS
jgi:hypothetical protein